jgi:hypothetical protein
MKRKRRPSVKKSTRGGTSPSQVNYFFLESLERRAMLALTTALDDLPMSLAENLSDESGMAAFQTDAGLDIPSSTTTVLTDDYTGTITNSGTLFADGDPTITIDGDYRQTASGTTKIDLGLPFFYPWINWSNPSQQLVDRDNSTSSFLNITGKAYLSGTLDVTNLTHSQPLKVGDRLPLMRFDGLEGRFTSMTGMDTDDPSLFLSLQYVMPRFGDAKQATGIDLVVLEKPTIIRADGTTGRLPSSTQTIGLSIVTHGFKDNDKDFRPLAREIAAKNPLWDSAVFDWSSEASFVRGVNPFWTAERAYDAGDSLRMWLQASKISYANYDLTAHSAGTWVISALADGLPAEKNVEATILDGFTPSNTRIAGVGAATVSANFDRGLNIYCKGDLWFTHEYRSTLVNIDISRLRSYWEVRNFVDSHKKPISWYQATVTQTPPQNPTLVDQLGFAMAPMSGNQTARKLLDDYRGATLIVKGDRTVTLQAGGAVEAPPSKMPLPEGYKKEQGDFTVLRAMTARVADGIRTSDADARRITGGSSTRSRTARATPTTPNFVSIPVFGAATAEGASSLVTSLLGADVADLSLDELYDLGFRIESAVSPEQLLLWAYGEGDAPSSLISVTLAKEISGSPATIVGNGSLSLGSGGKLLTATMNGTLQGSYSGSVNIVAGLHPTDGVYVQEGGALIVSADATAQITGTGNVLNLSGAEVSAQGSLAARLAVRLDDGDGIASERLFLGDGTLADALRSDGTTTLDGVLDVSAVRASVASLPAVKGSGSYNLADGSSSFVASAGGLDSTDVANLIRGLVDPLTRAAATAAKPFSNVPAVFGKSFSFNDNVFGFRDHIKQLVDDFADRIDQQPTVTGTALVDRVKLAISSAFATSGVNSNAAGSSVTDVSFDLSLPSRTFSKKIVVPNSFKLGGFTIDTSFIPDIDVAASIGLKTRVRLNDANGLQLLVDAGKTTIDVTAEISSGIDFTGKVAKVLDFSGTLAPSYKPAFKVSFAGGEMGVLQLLGSVNAIQPTDACRYLEMPVSIKLNPVDPLPEFDYRSSFRFDLGAIDSSDNAASFTQDMEKTGVFFRDINVAQNPNALIYDLFKRAGGPVLEKISNAIPEDIRKMLLGTMSLGKGYGDLTINDIIGANLGLGYDSPLDLVPYGLQVTPGIPYQVTSGPAQQLEKLLKIADLYDRAKQEWNSQISDKSFAEAPSSSTLSEAEELGLKFPIRDNILSSVTRILSGDPNVPLVTFTHDFVDDIISAVTKDAPGLADFVKSAVKANEGRVAVNIDTREIKKRIIKNISGKADPAVRETLAFLIQQAMPIDASLAFSLQSFFTVGVDTHFLASGTAAQRLTSSIYLDTAKPLFDFEFVASQFMAFDPTKLRNMSSILDTASPSGLSSAASKKRSVLGDLKREGTNAWNYVEQRAGPVTPAINDVTEAVAGVIDNVQQGYEKYGKERVDAFVNAAADIVEAGAEWIRNTLVYLPHVRFGSLVGGRVTVGVRDGADAGKLRLSEALSGEAELYASGNVAAEMAASFKAFNVEKSLRTGRQTLLKFDTSRVRHNNSGGGSVLGQVSTESPPNEFAEVADGALIVYGSPDSDTVSITSSAGKIVVTLGGVSQSFDEATIREITVSLDGQSKPKGSRIRTGLAVGGGNDVFTIGGDVPARIVVRVNGGGGNDEFCAVSGSSEFAGEVTFHGGGGGDNLIGGAGRTFLYGEDGIDILRAGSGYTMLDGGADPDVLSGPSEGPWTRGGGGLMVGGTGEDVLKVGNWSTGNWILVGGRLDTAGDQSQNFIYGGKGNDLLVAGDLFRAGGVPSPAATSGGKATMLGGEGDDAIYGSPFDDVCLGGNYDNSAFSGVDQIYAGDGTNLITPGNFIQSDDPSIVVASDTNVAGGVSRSETAVGGTGVDTFRLGVASTMISFRGKSGSDLFDIGTGDISSITGAVSVIAGSGMDDRIVVHDHGISTAADYRVNPVHVTSVVGGVASRSAAGTSRFGGLTYDATAEKLDLFGTDGVNVFDVQPSRFTAYFIDGNAPASGFVEASKGDYLKLDTKSTFPADSRGYGLDTSGRRLSIEERGKGRWDFTAGTGHKPVSFESIERFNHVDILAVAAEAGASSNAAVRVYDAETLAPLFTIDAAATYGIKYREGVRVATGDLDNDGLPDVAIAPGRMAAPVIKVFNGAPQAGVQGTEIVGLRIAADATYGSSFKGGVSITIGDVVGDTLNDIVLAPSRGPATVKVFRNKLVAGPPYAGFVQTPARTFDALPGQTGYIGGGTVAAGDVLGLGKQQIVVGSGVGIRGEVNVFDVRTQAATYASLLRIVDPTVPNNRGGVSVATGDLDADGRFDIVTGVGAGSGGWVRAYSGRTGRQLYGFQTAASLAATVPTRVAVRALDGDSRMAVFATWGADARQNYRIRRIDSATRVTVDQLQVPSQGLSGGGLNIG